MKTTDLLTFFQPEEPAGTASTFSIQTGDGPAVEVWVFARGKVSLSRFANANVSSDDDLRNLRQELAGVLQPGGGLLIYARPHNEVVKAQISRIEGPGYAPPKRMLRLSLCGDSRFEDIASNVDLEIGDHLLLPVSKDAEMRLSVLRDNLKGLPSDLESSVLNVIRRPSLEWRLDRIERALSLPPTTQAEQRRSRVSQGSFLERLYDFAMWKVPIGPAVGVALLLMAGTLFAYQRYSDRPGADTQNPDTSQTDPQTTTAPTFSAATFEPEPAPPRQTQDTESRKDETALSELRTAMAGSKDPAIHKLYASHFKDSAQLWQSGNPTPAFWGMAKLQALRMKIIPESEGMLGDPKTQTKIKATYGNKKSIEALKADRKALDLLGWLACQGSNQPAFPKTDQDPSPLPLPTDRTCDELKKPGSAVPGLEALIDWVSQQKK